MRVTAGAETPKTSAKADVETYRLHRFYSGQGDRPPPDSSCIAGLTVMLVPYVWHGTISMIPMINIPAKDMNLQVVKLLENHR